MRASLSAIVIKTNRPREMENFYSFIIGEKFDLILPGVWSVKLDKHQSLELRQHYEFERPLPDSFGEGLIFEIDDPYKMALMVCAEGFSEKMPKIVKDSTYLKNRPYIKLRDPDNRIILLLERAK